MKQSKKNRFNMLVVFVALCFLFIVGMESLAFARAGGGRSSGSRGFSSGGTSGGTYRSAPSQPSRHFSTAPAGSNSNTCGSASGSPFFRQKSPLWHRRRSHRRRHRQHVVRRPWLCRRRQRMGRRRFRFQRLYHHPDRPRYRLFHLQTLPGKKAGRNANERSRSRLRPVIRLQ